MENNRNEIGLKIMDDLTSKDNSNIPTHANIEEELGDVAPGLGKYVTEFAFGDIYSREGLDYRQCAISTISALVTLGTEPQLELHINVALTVGLTPQEISETIMHLLPYVGFPKVLNALKIVKRVYNDRGVTYSTK
ncbi:carboxymuconolactone decarboxylase family protein [Mammaliicoccus sciuri]|uniref:carboxymuconolactone decarboxylase family protein n=1 Tax=Mammaliicoccus sciuri TaxID=1296 RepID=UPI0039C4D91A